MAEHCIGDRLRRLIETSGPISVAHYMAEANAHYYASRDPLGAAGDFTTAPEVSQMFGELIGLCLADLWLRAERPPCRYAEFGPGRGTLAQDALRAMRAAGLQPAVEFVENSPLLREEQRKRVANVRWHDDVASLPEDTPLLIVANEFFDALPVRQLVATENGWRELMVDVGENGFVRRPGPLIPVPLAASEPGTIVETSPASTAIARELARRVSCQGGAALIIDYGHERSGPGDTLQAVSRHAYESPWEAPGTRDLTAHVDFQAMGEAAASAVRVMGPVPQGAWLRALGLEARAAALANGAPGRQEEIKAACHRLSAPEEMGVLFKVMAFVAPDWPDPAGFA